MTTQERRKIKRITCKWGCGAQLDTFVDSLGLRRYLESTALPITADIRDPQIFWRLWEKKDHPVGWSVKVPGTARTWRELRIEHACENAPKQRRGRQ